MLTVEDLWAGYGSRMVLHGVTLQVPPGRVVALLGPNGAGKTTLVRALTGWLPPRRGRVLWGTTDLLALPVPRRARFLAVVPQAVSLPAGFTVYQTVLLGRTPYLGWLGRARERDRAAVHRALERTHLLPLAHQAVHRLSGGERQRVLLARALAQETPVLILDEPTAHLDLRHQLTTLRLLRELTRQEGKATLVILHDINLAARFADEVVLLHRGKVAAWGPPERVLTPERLRQVYGVHVRVLRTNGTQAIIPWDVVSEAESM